MAKKIICLVGLKGSGKSFLGSLLELHFAIPFVRVEDLWLSLSLEMESRSEDYISEGFRRQETCLLQQLDMHPVLSFESTGTTSHFSGLIQRLSVAAEVFFVRVIADPTLCAARVRARDHSIHVDVSDQHLREINSEALKVDLPWSLEIDNGDDSDPLDTARKIASALHLGPQP